MSHYTIASYFVRRNHIHGGTIIYTKNQLQFKNIDAVNEFSCEMNIECCGIAFVFENQSYIIVCIYRPPSGDIDTFFNRVNDILMISCRKYSNVILCGDFNIDCSKDSIVRKQFLDLIQSYELKIKNMEYTRVSPNSRGGISSTKIDYFLTNVPLEHYNETVEQYHISDHEALKMELLGGNAEVASLKEKNRKCRSTNLNNLNKLGEQLGKETFHDVFDKVSVNDMYECFLNTINYYLELTCPYVNIKVSRDNNRLWVNREITDMGRKLKDMFWVIKNSVNNNQLYEQYKELKKRYEILIDSSRKENFHNRLINKDHLTKQKEVWKMVRERTGKKSEIKNNITIKYENILQSNPVDVANAFCSHFTNVVPQALENHFKGNKSSECTLVDYQPNSFFFIPVVSQDIIDAISGLRNTNSLGVDCISTRVVKHVAHLIANPLSHIINYSVSQGKFPSLLKTGKVIPVLKKNNPQDLNNYRPITILNTISKTVEKVMHTKIMDYLNKYNILTSSQHGFRSGKSTESATYNYTEFIFKNLDKRKCVCTLLFDLTKAFDCLNHSFLEEKLSRLGFRNNILEWIVSYLSGRQIFVSCNDVESDIYELVTGVPQGSVLGPLFFLLYINDLPTYLETECTVLYADDTSIVVSADTPEELNVKLSITFKKFMDWCQRNSLIANPQKTELLYFTNRRTLDTPFVLSLQNTTIESSPHAKFLGVYVDSDMSWRTQIDFVCKRLAKSYYALFQLTKLFNLTQLLSVYYALVYSTLAYNVASWGNAVDSGRVFIMQKKIIRLIFKLGWSDSCLPLFKSQKILTFPCIYIYKTIIYVRANVNTFPTNGQNHDYSTRHGSTLIPSKHHTALMEKSISYAGIRLYNKLPTHIKNKRSDRSFKTSLKEFLYEKAYYSVKDYINEIIRD